MKRLSSYPKVYNLGHPAVAALLDGPVVVQEKIDGSQFSFGVIDGTLCFRSKGQEVHAGEPGMFREATEALADLASLLHPGWIYRAEYLQKPKHNVLAYDRIPRRHVILFDVTIGLETFLDPIALDIEADRLGLERVQAFPDDLACSVDGVRELLQADSALGGQKIEGIVIKGYGRFGADGKTLMGKHVSEAFKETHRVDWKERNPGGRDILSLLGQKYRSEARWRKAIQHLRERGQLQQAPQDIGPLMREIQTDVYDECAAEIKDALFKWAWKSMTRVLTAGFPEWYKNELLQAQFEQGATNGCAVDHPEGTSSERQDDLGEDAVRTDGSETRQQG